MGEGGTPCVCECPAKEGGDDDAGIEAEGEERERARLVRLVRDLGAEQVSRARVLGGDEQTHMADLRIAMFPFMTPEIHLEMQMVTKLRLNPNASADNVDPRQP